MMEVGIMQYGIVLGSNLRTVDDVASHKDKETIRKIKAAGLKVVPTDNNKLIVDMIVQAYRKITILPELIIIAHSLPFLFCNRFDISKNLDDIETIIMSGMPCAIMHEVVGISKMYIESGQYKRILIIGADKAYSDQERTFFNTIMGDCVIALLIGADKNDNKILSSHVQTTVIAPDGELSEEIKTNEFRAVNASLVRQAMEQCIIKANLSWKDISYIVPHTSNSMFWDAIANLMHMERSKFMDINISQTGHFNSHDSFYHYLTLVKRHQIKEGQNVLLINPGFGGTQGCTVICC